jgi:hypothetical protein
MTAPGISTDRIDWLYDIPFASAALTERCPEQSAAVL